MGKTEKQKGPNGYTTKSCITIHQFSIKSLVKQRQNSKYKKIQSRFLLEIGFVWILKRWEGGTSPRPSGRLDSGTKKQNGLKFFVFLE